ncbi:unnamed protein product [marine sediment metagenome]|uniref:Uncharacterized protein n=1 Tax=marine sediment metagenome TaxID=412755 RepID=X0TXE0_9ZZZZ
MGGLLPKPALFPALERLATSAKPETLVAAKALGGCGVTALPPSDETRLAY